MCLFHILVLYENNVTRVLDSFHHCFELSADAHHKEIVIRWTTRQMALYAGIQLASCYLPIATFTRCWL